MKRQFQYPDRLNDFRQSPAISERITPFNRILDRIRFYGRILLANNLNSRVVNFMIDSTLIQISRDVDKLEDFGQSRSIEGRIELFNRVSDIIGLLERTVLAGDRNNGIGNLIDDLTLDRLSDIDNLNNFRPSLTNVDKIRLLNCLLDKISFLGRMLLSFDRSRIISLLINLRLSQLSIDVDNLGNFRESTTNAEIIEFFNRLLGNGYLLGGISLAGDDYVDVLDDPIRYAKNIRTNQN